MPLKFYQPTTPGRRHASVDAFSDVTRNRPEKSLILIKKERAGRNALGRITVRHRGGGAKRFLRIVDFRENRYNIPAVVDSIEYDPNRTARIALVVYTDGVKRYILAPQSLKVGDTIVSSQHAIKVEVGNRMPLAHIPVGISVYNVELFPGKGGQIARSAGTLVKVAALEGNDALLRLPSGEVRKVSKECLASIGEVSNPDSRHVRLGKAGRMRHLGIRPTVRGKVMNPVDHPHGGGEGRNPIGLKYPKTPWGKHALGVKTRKNQKSNKYIVQRRKK
jgi:large subunit ribosomal protein L2